jgi:CRISPR-associated endoribonuclease Cas6
VIYHELNISVVPKYDMELRGIGEILGKHVSYAMEKDMELYNLHGKDGIKLYCYDYLYPRAESINRIKKYRKDKKYSFRLRTPIYDLAERFAKVLTVTTSNYFHGVGVSYKEKKFRFAGEIYTATPVYITLNEDEEGKITSQGLTEKITNNLSRKFEIVFKKSIEEQDFIEFIEKKNIKPIAMNYKSATLFGDKYRFCISESENSQKLAYIAISCGVLEKSTSLGCGFVTYKGR